MRLYRVQGYGYWIAGATVQPKSAWKEEYKGGSAEAERLEFEQLARDIMGVQLDNRAASNAAAVQRGFHAKIDCGVAHATLSILSDVPARFQVGYVRPGAEYQASVRFSNANGAARADAKRDMRGIAVRIEVFDGEYHDLLATNFPASHARDARQFVVFAKAMAGSKLLLLPRLIFSVGPFETVRIFRNVLKASRRQTRSLALESYWSRGAMLWGAEPVRFLWRPPADAAVAPDPAKTDPDYLHHELADRLRGGDVVFDLFLQPYVDADRTPIEDTAVRWRERVSPAEPVAVLTLAGGDLSTADALAQARLIDADGVQPVEHHRRVPPARQPQPGPQGGLRRQFGAAVWATGGRPRHPRGTW